MNLRTEVLIVGAGLAGACLASFLRRDREVLLADAGTRAGGASGAAAGLVNPLLGRRARPVWEMEDALDAFHELLYESGAADLFVDSGILRPAVNHEQARRFARSADRYKNVAHWLTPSEMTNRYPTVIAPQGALYVREAGAIAIPTLCHRLIDGLDVREGWRLHTFEETSDRVHAHFMTSRGSVGVDADVLVLAIGPGYRHLPQTRILDLHSIKGQTVTVEVERDLPEGHPHIAGIGYVVIEPPNGVAGHNGGARLVLGSTYQHEFSDELPRPDATDEILERTQVLMPMLGSAAIVEERAGIRVTVPRTRLPMVGPLPGFGRSWIFSGLGAKGLLMAPMLGRRMLDWMQDPGRIPHDLRPRVRE